MKNITHSIPKAVRQELIRLHHTDPDWCQVRILEPASESNGWKGRFAARAKVPTWLSEKGYTVNANDWLGLKALSCWLGTGPKVFIPSDYQLEAMEQLDIGMKVSEVSLPFPALAVVCHMDPFHWVLVYRCSDTGLVVTSTMSPPYHSEDVVNLLYPDAQLEEGLAKMQPDVEQWTNHCRRLGRIAYNSALLLTHYPTVMEYLNSGEVNRDKKILTKKKMIHKYHEVKERIRLAPMRVDFDKTVKFFTETPVSDPSSPTGKHLSPHWRRGHWKMQPCGPKNSERKRILIQPYPVNFEADTDLSGVTTTYKG